MTIWGRIEQGKVVELVDFDPANRYHPDLVWEVVPEGTVPGATRGAGGEWANPDQPEENRVAGGPGDEPAPPTVDIAEQQRIADEREAEKQKAQEEAQQAQEEGRAPSGSMDEADEDGEDDDVTDKPENF